MRFYPVKYASALVYARAVLHCFCLQISHSVLQRYRNVYLLPCKIKNRSISVPQQRTNNKALLFTNVLMWLWGINSRQSMKTFLLLHKFDRNVVFCFSWNDAASLKLTLHFYIVESVCWLCLVITVHSHPGYSTPSEGSTNNQFKISIWFGQNHYSWSQSII